MNWKYTHNTIASRSAAALVSSPYASLCFSHMLCRDYCKDRRYVYIKTFCQAPSLTLRSANATLHCHSGSASGWSSAGLQSDPRCQDNPSSAMTSVGKLDPPAAWWAHVFLGSSLCSEVVLQSWQIWASFCPMLLCISNLVSCCFHGNAKLNFCCRKWQ